MKISYRIKKQYITSEYERLKKQKEDNLKRQEEILYQQALVEAKVKARIVNQQKFLEEEALKELRTIDFLEESKNPDLISFNILICKVIR